MAPSRGGGRATAAATALAALVADRGADGGAPAWARPGGDPLKVPWYLDCRHSEEWSAFREALWVAHTQQDDRYQEELFWWSHHLLERTEPLFLTVQASKHMFYLCEPLDNKTSDGTAPSSSSWTSWGVEDLRVGRVSTDPFEAEESVFEVEGGTGQWTEEERQRRGLLLQDFCYYGYVSALAYRTRLTDSGVRGVKEGADVALDVLQALLMSRGNALDFMEASGWPLSTPHVLRHLYPPSGLAVERRATDLSQGPNGLDEAEQALQDDTERPLEPALAAVLPPRGPAPLELAAAGRKAAAGDRAVRVATIGYHTTLVLELVAQWEELPLQGGPAVEVTGHILEPSATTAEEVRRSSMCKWFRDGDLCAWDARLLDLNGRHVMRGRLPLAKLPSPLFEDPEAFLADFAAAFGRAGAAAAASGQSGLDSRIDTADVYLCTEPALLCGALGRAFPDRPIVAYFANPLCSYVPAASAQRWLAEFAALAAPGAHRPGFLAVASTRFLAEQVRFQTGVRTLAARPLALYLGAASGFPRHRPGEVVVLRAPSLFWGAACVLNALAQLNAPELARARASNGNIGMPGPTFTASEELKDGATEVFASFEAVVIFPYDVSQMRLYEVYAMGLPTLVPARDSLPSYMYRGMTTIDDFNHTLPVSLQARFVNDREDDGAYFKHSPFNRDSWEAVSLWTELTHWARLPYLVRCDGAMDMLLRLARDDMRPLSAGMRRRQERDIVRGLRFWSEAFQRLLQ